MERGELGAALTVAVAQSRGLFEYDDRISAYWPEFAQNGKENMTVRELMSFQSGLCYIDQKLDEKMIADPEAQIGFAYAPNKLGFYMYNDPREKALRGEVYRCIM